MMKYFINVNQNEILIEVQIRIDRHPASGYISAKKLLNYEAGGRVEPAVIDVPVWRQMSPQRASEIAAWLQAAISIANLLDLNITTQESFGVKWAVRWMGPLGFILERAEVE